LPETILAELGYSFGLKILDLPIAQDIDQEVLNGLRASYYAIVAKVSLNSQAAKRQVIVAPLLHSVVRQVDAKLNVEYPLDVDSKLSGTVDYLFRAKQQLVVIKAERGDLEQGFNQLIAEMVAVDKYEEPEATGLLYGVITIGQIWCFAVLDRKQKHLTKDINNYRFPEDLETLFAILKGILTAT
jgi:hypothetical protein